MDREPLEIRTTNPKESQHKYHPCAANTLRTYTYTISEMRPPLSQHISPPCWPSGLAEDDLPNNDRENTNITTTTTTTTTRNDADLNQHDMKDNDTVYAEGHVDMDVNIDREKEEEEEEEGQQDQQNDSTTSIRTSTTKPATSSQPSTTTTTFKDELLILLSILPPRGCSAEQLHGPDEYYDADRTCDADQGVGAKGRTPLEAGNRLSGHEKEELMDIGDCKDCHCE